VSFVAAASLLLTFALGIGCEPAYPFAHLASLAPPATQPVEPQRFEYHAIKMGSNFNIVLYASDKAAADAARDALFARVDQLTKVFSDYDAASEIRQLSMRAHTAPMTQPAAVSQDLWNVLDASKSAFDASGGVFDITIGPCVQLWKRSRGLQELPSPERLADAKSAVGFDKLKLDSKRHSATLTAAKMRLDVGGIATGYIVDDGIRLLRRRGINSAIIDGSGDLAIGDPPPGRKGWRVAIQSLLKPEEAADFVELANCGISTSGDTYRFVEIDGVRYSHILDPATGLGLTRRIGATVIAPNDITADWLATAMCILGPEKGLELAETLPGAAARITTLEGETVKVVVSKRYGLLEHPRAPASRPATKAQ
jgi:thiamine biosynthesis lipoprotein